jgi:starch-binding outer membrane protein, SusD/RagB family
MKKIFTYTLISCLAMTSLSCGDKFLEIAPVDRANVANFYKNESDFEAAVVGLYSNWRVATVRPPMFTEYRADNLTNDRFYGYELATNDLTPNIASVYWNMYGTLVYPANLILDKIDQVSGINEQAARRMKGEALFMRGYAYYWMNLVLGGVPIVTTEITANEALVKARATEQETWQQITADFTQAASLLPQRPSTFGRIDQFDAKAFLAKTYLQQQRWAEAVPVLADIYANSGHILEPVWTNMWNLPGQKNSRELMLTSIWSDLIPNNDFAQQFLRIDGDPTTQGVFIYKPGLLNSFETNDLRKNASVGVTPLGFDQNRKYQFGKVLNNWTMDVVVLRFTDIVLMYAEALTMAAGSVQQQSIDLLNLTRKRAGLPERTMADFPNQNAFVEAILAERRAEFIFESSRFADLKRHGKLLEKLANIGFNFSENYKFLPIPQSEIDKMPNVLKQNPGY